MKIDSTTEVPTDIGEYQKFVAAGGLNANAAKPSTSSEAGENHAGTESDSETDRQTQGKEPHQKKSGFQRRVDKLNQKLGAKDAEIADLRKQLEARGNGATAKTGDAKQDADKPAGEKKESTAAEKPQQKDFETYDEYIEALTDWKTEQALLKREQSKQADQQKQTAEEQTKAVLDAHAARVDEAKTRYADWDKAFEGMTDSSFTDAIMVAIFESDHGPDITYHLAKHRDELARIAALSPIRQAAEIGKIETRFAKADDSDDDAGGKADEKPEPKPKPRVTQAPAPAKPLKGKGTGDDPMPDPSDFEAYEAWSRRQAAAGKKR